MEEFLCARSTSKAGTRSDNPYVMKIVGHTQTHREQSIDLASDKFL